MFSVLQTCIKIPEHFKVLSRTVYFYCHYGTAHFLQNACVTTYMSGNDKAIQLIKEDFKVHPNFISEDEENELLNEIDAVLKRRRYEKDHWDDAIKFYKETEKTDWNEKNSKIIKRLRNIAFPTELSLIRPVHVLDLSKDGYIKPHIDSVRFCGETIAGISLLSCSVMRLVMEDDKNISVDIILPRRSLYIMKGIARYKFTHEILENKISYFKGKKVERDRRISVICRSEPVENL